MAATSPGLDREVQPAEDRLAVDRNAEILDFEHRDAPPYVRVAM